MTWRLDELLLAIFQHLGIFGLLAVLAILVYALFANLLRAMGLAFVLLIASQTWWIPGLVIGRTFRWWVLFIVCGRGLIAIRRIPKGPGAGLGRLPVIALACLALASSLWAADAKFAFGTAFSFVLTLVATFVVLWRLLDGVDIGRAATRGAVLLALLVAGSSLACSAAWEVSGSPAVARAAFGGRYSGVFFNPNMLGVLCMMLVPLVATSTREVVGRLSWLRFPVLLMLGTCIFLSGSRSAVIGTTASIVLLFMYRYGMGAIVMVAAGAVCLYVANEVAPLEHLDESAIGHITRTGKLSTLSGRVALWEQGFDAVRGRELIGNGWGGSRLLDGGDTETALEYGTVLHSSNLHSAHIQILVDLGYTGLVLFWIICLQTLLAGWTILREPRGASISPVVVILIAFVATLADTFVHGGVLSTGNPAAIVFWASAAVVLKHGSRVRAAKIAAGVVPPQRVAPERAPGVPRLATPVG